jgi:hypothetical protein
MPEEQSSLLDSGMKRSERELQSYFRPSDRMRDNPYIKIHLAEITKIELNENGRPTGRATVRLLTLPGVRSSVLMPVPSSQYWFHGSLPPINTLVSVGWLPQNIAIILNYYPLNLKQLKEKKDLPDLETGEIYMRAQIKQGTTNVPGGTIFLDKDGAVVLKDKDEKTTVAMDADGNVTINADTKVTVNCSEVNLGGEAGEKLVKESFISRFNSHTHTGVTTGAGTSGTPVSPSSGDTTSKTSAE